ncbi:CelD/BcsL family acetyltransferase involved in cellulose biosynthesis [Microvirga flocculans]|uniref:CelD/BcsL family acetyltransferase involved in cellulose biosynthesis n=1 Tax=Microvirga flocculans TaxID=217168 RepID=A0A7W6IFZ1_9HYPH|nr:GNAT family N-acetyltransferase [Microvirga flocculans]MBB4040791.1 CelD/BcsL family acetyltransferase involved in cellulose biosynthesis [Microvirga flocculans]
MTAVEVIDDLSRLEAIEKEWHALARDIPWPMAQFEWIISAARTYSRERLYLVTIREAGALQAAAPLILQNYGLTHRLECLDRDLSEPQGLIARSCHYRKLLFKALRNLHYPFILRGVPAECEEVECFDSAPGFGLNLVTASCCKDSFVPFDDPGRDVEQRMSQSRRTTLRRKRRAAEKHGLVRFSILHPDPNDFPRMFDEFLRVESSGWKGKAATGLRHDHKRASFFRTYCAQMAGEGALRFGFMTIGDATAAVRIDVIWGKKSWELKIGYDETFAKYSPGLLLSHEALKSGQANGLLGHHFLGTAEPWHDTWAAEKTHRVVLRHYPATMAGGMAFMQDACTHLGHGMSKLFQKHLTVRASSDHHPFSAVIKK